MEKAIIPFVEEMNDYELVIEYKKLYSLYLIEPEDRETEHNLRHIGKEIKFRNIVDLIGPRRKLIW